MKQVSRSAVAAVATVLGLLGGCTTSAAPQAGKTSAQSQPASQTPSSSRACWNSRPAQDPREARNTALWGPVFASGTVVDRAFEETTIDPGCAEPPSGQLACPDDSGWPVHQSRAASARTLAGWGVSDMLVSRFITETSDPQKTQTWTVIDLAGADPKEVSGWAQGCSGATTGRVRASGPRQVVVMTGDSWTPAREKAAMASLR